MKDNHFKIVVGDILRDSSIKDNIHFKEKFSSLFPQIVNPGIETTLIVQGMDRHSLLVIFDYIQATVACCCDKCGEEFSHTIYVETKEVKCFFDGKRETDEDEDVLYYDPSDKVIDIEEFLVQSLQLEDSYVHVCTTCQQNGDEDITTY